MSTLDSRKNFVTAQLAAGYSDNAVSIDLESTLGDLFPDPSVQPYNLVWWNSSDYANPAEDPNVEIVRVTAKSTDTLTVVRGQESTSATSKNTSNSVYTVILAPTAKMFTDIESELDLKVATSELAGVAFSGEYSDLLNKPSLGTVAELNTGTADGDIPIIGSGGKIDTSVLPALSISETFVVANEVAQLALTVQEGDVAIRTDENKSYIALNADNVDMGDWQELLAPTDAVQSVAGKNGVVTLVKGDVGLGNLDNTSDANKPVSTAQQTALNLKANILTPTFTTNITTPLIIGGTAVGSNLIYKSTTGVGTPTGIAHQFIGGTNGATVAMTVLNNGNVGIGTSSPDSTLTVQNTGTGNSFFVGDQASDATPFVIDASGNVGIGTANPVGVFNIVTGNTIVQELEGSGSVTFIDLNNTNTGETGIRFQDNGSGRWVAGSDADNSDAFQISGGTAFGTNDFFTIENVGGNIGIGTTAPDTKLHVAGAMTQEPLSSDPADPDVGNSVQWVSDGTGSGDAGDFMMKINVGGTTKVITLIDYSAA